MLAGARDPEHRHTSPSLRRDDRLADQWDLAMGHLLVAFLEGTALHAYVAARAFTAAALSGFRSGGAFAGGGPGFASASRGPSLATGKVERPTCSVKLEICP
jgi:hypothetical protein